MRSDEISLGRNVTTPRLRRASSSAAVWIAFRTVLALLISGCAGSGSHDAERARLSGEIASRRARGEYAAAARIADDLLSRLRRDPFAKPFQRADAERLAATMRRAASLDSTSRRELAEADRLTTAIERLSKTGEVAQAYAQSMRQLEIRQRIVGREHEEVAESMDRVGQAAAARWDFWGALEWHTRALEMRKRLLGPEHPAVGESLDHLARALKPFDQHRRAQELFEQAIAVRRQALGPDSPELAESLNGLANVYRRFEQYAEARKLLLRALEIRRRVLGEKSLDVADSRTDLGLVYLRLGQWNRARHELGAAARIQQELLGPDHPNRRLALSLLGYSLQAQGRYEEALRAHSDGARIAELQRLQLPPGLARHFHNLTEHEGVAANLLALGRPDEAWLAMERGRGRITAELVLPESTFALATLGRADRYGPSYPFPLERVQRALPVGAALIGWLDATPGLREPHSAWGYVIRPRGPVRWVRLDSGAAAIGPLEFYHRFFRGDALSASLAAAGAWPFQLDSTTEVRKKGHAYWKQRIAPLMPYLGGVSELIVEGTGGFLAPVEALVDSAGEFLSRRFGISYTNSATAYAWFRERALHARVAGRRRALLIGDPVFSETQPDNMERGSASDLEAMPRRVPLPETRVLRGAASGDRLALARLPRLPHTRWEVQRLSRLMPGSTVLLGAKASEQELYRLDRSNRLAEFNTIHLATHVLGGAFPAAPAAALAAHGDRGRRAANAAPDPADGLLRPFEIVERLHLRADLITLGGCNSAAAGGQYGENLLSLAMPFLAAGANSVLGAMWRSDDRATALLMVRFYENLTGTYTGNRGFGGAVAMRKVDALREAKNWLPTYRDARGRRPYEHPAYWAAFILVGDPG